MGWPCSRSSIARLILFGEGPSATEVVTTTSISNKQAVRFVVFMRILHLGINNIPTPVQSLVENDHDSNELHRSRVRPSAAGRRRALDDLRVAPAGDIFLSTSQADTHMARYRWHAVAAALGMLC